MESLLSRSATASLALPARRRSHSICLRAAAEDGRRSGDALSALDSLLPGAAEHAPPARDAAGVEWWGVRPRQRAPPRTTSISSSRSPAGRFIANEEMLRNEVWVGRKTQLGQALELPKASPYLSYVLALVNAAVYATLVRVSEAQGPDAAAELLAGLGFSRDAVVEQGELWRLLSGPLVHSDLLPLAVVMYGMLAVAPRVEASLGQPTFAAAYLMSGVAAADAFLVLSQPAAASMSDAAAVAASDAASAEAASGAAAWGSELLDAALRPAGEVLAAVVGQSGAAGLELGALGAAMGLAGCAAAHQWINGDVERGASGQDASSSSSGGVGGGRRAPDVSAALLAASCVGSGLLQAQSYGGGAAVMAALGVGFGTGLALASCAGPRYQVTREVDLPDGVMWIPEPEAVLEMTVVLDTTTSIQRSLATAAVGLVVMLGSVVAVYGAGQ
ncbi:hypothetical protein TSOC_001080 [Tetrabaena socialis]|uniref:Peptidase S54 rhomboid domain-containing protein n=1 Tax=Tetrabaena socialis TaxID=47790 RepID=A0A2J8AHQ6_9CHLO|nr:hypothetical protein TSOC_001080 [Tetrabaena socialis]|eukprot:PNH12054.1 hypothetical protein TSOC_001080 [Tetrabaena socialis]